MKTENTHPNLTKSLAPKPNKSRPKVLIAGILVLLLIVVGYVVWSQLPDTSAPIASTPPATQQTDAAQPAAIPVEDVVDSANNGDTLDENTDAQISDSRNILDAPLPETDSLAKEEIDRLNDEHQQLADQEKLAAEQVTMNKQLMDMKAEQIELLEQQIAQLEADKIATSATK